MDIIFSGRYPPDDLRFSPLAPGVGDPHPQAADACRRDACRRDHHHLRFPADEPRQAGVDANHDRRFFLARLCFSVSPVPMGGVSFYGISHRLVVHENPLRRDFTHNPPLVFPRRDNDRRFASGSGAPAQCLSQFIVLGRQPAICSTPDRMRVIVDVVPVSIRTGRQGNNPDQERSAPGCSSSLRARVAPGLRRSSADRLRARLPVESLSRVRPDPLIFSVREDFPHCRARHVFAGLVLALAEKL